MFQELARTLIAQSVQSMEMSSMFYSRSMIGLKYVVAACLLQVCSLSESRQWESAMFVIQF